MRDAVTLVLMILVPTLVVLFGVFLTTGIVLDVGWTYIAVGFLMYLLLKAHQMGLRNPVGRLIVFALT